MQDRRQLVTMQQVRKVAITHITSEKQLLLKVITTGKQVYQYKAKCGY
jgi:hypothetical protein